MNLVEHIATLLTKKGWNPRVIRAGSRLHRFLFKTLRLGRSRLIGEDSLILTTLGRRSGRETSTPLFYAQDKRQTVCGRFVRRQWAAAQLVSQPGRSPGNDR